MNVVIGGNNVYLDWVQVEISANDFTRQFTFKDMSEVQEYSEGDLVQIYDKSERLLIEAEIEYVSVGEESECMYVYAGRNNAKYISDCDADKTIQFSESQKVDDVLSEIAGGFGLKVTGTAAMPKEEIKTILIGDNLGDAFLEIAKSSGKVITSDAEGNIIIEAKAENTSNTDVEYGVNVRKRFYEHNTTNMYERYVVLAQGNYLVSQKQDVDVQGEYGAGKFVKVVRSKSALTASECEVLAKAEFERDYRKSLSYSAVMDSEIDFDVNTKFQVKDATIGLEEEMNLKALVFTTAADKDEVMATFERMM